MSIVISDTQKKELINNNFHQYFNITLKSANSFYQGFSHDIQFSYYQNTSVNTILSQYSNTDITDFDENLICIKVIDGDTLLLSNNERIRLVGVNTPEKGIQGYETSKKFMEKICLNQTLNIKIDSQKPQDNYGRTLAVVCYQNKNLNQILLKEGLAEIMYIPPSSFDPYSWDDNAAEHTETDTILSTNLENQFLNVTIPLNEICGDDYGIAAFLNYFNEDFNNIVVTKSNDFNTLYKCEIYKKTLFIRIDPISINQDNKITIALHLLPKRYNGSDNILLFKDDYTFLNQKKLQLVEDLIDRFYTKHRYYETDKEGNYILNNIQDKIPKDIINAFFQSGLNGVDRTDRYHINENNYPEFDKFDISKFFYQDYNENNEWIQEIWNNEKIYAEFDCDMSGYTGNLINMQIDGCYSYNESSPTNAIHYMGFKDKTNTNIADRCNLIDANLDKIIDDKTTTNYISQLMYNDNEIEFPTTLDTVQIDNSYTHHHTNNIGRKHYKTIKYFNDRLYSSEKSIVDNEVVEQGYTIGDWKDLSQ